MKSGEEGEEKLPFLNRVNQSKEGATLKGFFLKREINEVCREIWGNGGRSMLKFFGEGEGFERVFLKRGGT